MYILIANVDSYRKIQVLEINDCGQDSKETKKHLELRLWKICYKLTLLVLDF